MEYFPIFLDLKGRRCLVVGNGATAAAKAAQLARAGAAVGLVAAALSPALRDAVRSGTATHLARQFAPALLDGAALVMVADEAPAVNEAVSAAARARGIPVNVMDDVPLSSFIMPAIVDRAPVTIAISTGGAAPLLAGLLRHWLEDALPQRLGGLAALAGRFRGLAKARLSNARERRRFWQDVLTGETAKRALVGDDVAAEAALRRALDERRAASTRGDEAA